MDYKHYLHLLNKYVNNGTILKSDLERLEVKIALNKLYELGKYDSVYIDDSGKLDIW